MGNIAETKPNFASILDLVNIGETIPNFGSILDLVNIAETKIIEITNMANETIFFF